jgi:hypothetical protein
MRFGRAFLICGVASVNRHISCRVATRLRQHKEEGLKTVRIALLFVAFALILVPTALAHTQTVAPPGQDEPVISSDPIARPWIQGHCRSAAPMVAGEASGGVASFSPAAELPCDPAILNPGGQSTGPNR